MAVPITVGGVTRPEIQLRTESARHEIVDFLVSVWAGEDPYRSFEDPQARAQVDIARDVRAAALVVVAEGATGTEGAVVVTHDTRTGDPMLSSLAVASPARRRGIATALLGSVLAYLADQSTERLRSAVSAANIPSLWWHLGCGFTLDAPHASDHQHP